MEKVPTDEDDRPKKDIKITGATVFVNPYKDEEEAERKAAEEARLKVGAKKVEFCLESRAEGCANGQAQGLRGMGVRGEQLWCHRQGLAWRWISPSHKLTASCVLQH